MKVMSVYALAGMETRDPLALYNGKYLEADQRAIKDGTWDYDDPNFLCNRIFLAIESLDPHLLTPEELVWFRRLRWFWNHHAISCAIYKKADKRKAQEYARKAMRLQRGDHQTHITCILFYLVNDRPKEAKAHLRVIPQGELHKDERNDTGP